VGTRGMLLWDGQTGYTATVKAGDEGFLRPVEQLSLPPPHDWAETNGHRSVLGAFLDALDAGREPETVGHDNIKSLSMVFAAIESARLAARVPVATQ
jgi:hypothetical protein